jgi:hypothetical protein
MVRKRLQEQITGIRKFSTNRFTIYYSDDFIEVMKDFNRVIKFGERVPLVDDEIKGKNRFSPAIRALIKMYVNTYWERNKEIRKAEEKEKENSDNKLAKIQQEIKELDKKRYGDDYEGE